MDAEYARAGPVGAVLSECAPWPTVYDAATDTSRPMTQHELDLCLRGARSAAMMRESIRRLCLTHGQREPVTVAELRNLLAESEA